METKEYLNDGHFGIRCMGLDHAAAMLSPRGLKTFVLPHRSSFPNFSTRGSG